MAKKNTAKRIYKSNNKPINRINEIMIIAICVIFVIVGLFFVYKSFAATITR